jgi:siroheme synthase-like protein
VVGGGSVAERKVLALVKAGAAVTVISPVLTKRLLREKARNTIRHIERGYRGGDLGKSFLVIAATDSPSLNSRVARAAPALVNVVDVPRECTFIAPSVIRRGPLTIAISTGGKSPAFARTLRKELERTIGPEVASYLKFMGAMREKARAGIRDRKRREQFLKGLASGDILELLRSKGLAQVTRAAEAQLKKLAASG